MDQIEGRNPVLEALIAGRRLQTVYLAKGSKGGVVQEITSLCSGKGVAVKWLDRSALEEKARTGSHQGVIAVGEQPKEYSLADVLAAIDLSTRPIMVMLDHLQDPQNFGAILRTAETAGVKAVIVPKKRSVGLTPAALKVAAGAAEYVPVVTVTNLAQTIDELKDKGFWLAGAEADAPASVFDTDLAMPLVLVIGSEGKGLSRLVREKCDLLVSLPLQGRLNSLNASAAAAVLIFEAVRQRL